jgi:hypothetical protein
MISNLFDMMFGCRHTNYSFPITTKGAKRRTPAASLTGTYIVCLDCGKEFAYDWKEMKVISSEPTPAPSRVPAEAVGWHANKAA